MAQSWSSSSPIGGMVERLAKCPDERQSGKISGCYKTGELGKSSQAGRADIVKIRGGILNEDLYLKLAEQFGDQAHHGDTFSHSFDKITPGSLVSLDFNKFTTLTLVTGVTKDRDYLKDFKEIEQRGARYVHLTDCAGLKMHFHLHNYSKRFNHKVEDRYDYCQAVQPTYRNLLGWNMLGFRYHPGAFHFLFSTSSYPQTEPCATFDNKNVRGFPSGKK